MGSQGLSADAVPDGLLDRDSKRRFLFAIIGIPLLV